MGTDLAVVAIARGTSEMQGTAEQLVRGMLGEVFEESSVGLQVREDRREEVGQHIQDALREFRRMRRHASPVRELASELKDRELAEALTSTGGMLMVARLVEQKMMSVQQEGLQEWSDKVFQTEGDALVIRDEAREHVHELMAAIERIESSLKENNDF